MSHAKFDTVEDRIVDSSMKRVGDRIFWITHKDLSSILLGLEPGTGLDIPSPVHFTVLTNDGEDESIDINIIDKVSIDKGSIVLHGDLSNVRLTQSESIRIAISYASSSMDSVSI